MSLKDKIYSKSPNFVHNCLISIFNYLAYAKRYGKNYAFFLKQFKINRSLTLAELQEVQRNRYHDFVSKAFLQSPFYKKLYQDITDFDQLNNISKLPILDKEAFRKNIAEIVTIPKSKGIVSKTGGTTGKSLEVVFTESDMQERFAMLDDFRGRFGYKLGEKTAWFSGKNLLTAADLNANRFWKTDYLHKVRYYSTFHIKDAYLVHYIENLIRFKPAYMVGFPSTIAEIAKFGLNQGMVFPEGIVKAVFPTAETVTQELRTTIETFFKTTVYDQYASSEGAPFIIECANRKLHLELQSGVFEVLDENNAPTNYGRLVVTSFTTSGTPLIRYDIGDQLELSTEHCNCGNNNPLVKQILGRIDDYVYSPENGKINLGNVSNTLKDTKGIIKFQVVQSKLNAITIKLIIDEVLYTPKIEAQFMSNWIDRVGNKMDIDIVYVNDIEVEKSGKYRMVKNEIKHLIQ